MKKRAPFFIVARLDSRAISFVSLTRYPGTGCTVREESFPWLREWTIGQLAKMAGVNVQTARYCERRSLLPPTDRTLPRETAHRWLSDSQEIG
jgi:hypothetical protein